MSRGLTDSGVRGLLAVQRAAVTDAAAKRAAFWTQMGSMALNDVAWVAFWLVFFHQVESVRGWTSDTVLLLFAVLTTSAGFVMGLLSNCRRIPDLVQDGALDEALTLPLPVLPHLLVRRIDPVNFGDTAFGIVLFAVAAHPTPQRTAVFLVGSALAAVVLTGFLVAIGSTVFFTGRGEPGGLSLNAIVMLASYPVDVFSGPTKTLLYTLVPAAFVAAVPTRLVAAPTWHDAAALALAAVVFALLAWATFTLGLRRYASGSAWSR